MPHGGQAGTIYAGTIYAGTLATGIYNYTAQ